MRTLRGKQLSCSTSVTDHYCTPSYRLHSKSCLQEPRDHFSPLLPLARHPATNASAMALWSPSRQTPDGSRHHASRAHRSSSPLHPEIRVRADSASSTSKLQYYSTGNPTPPQAYAQEHMKKWAPRAHFSRFSHCITLMDPQGLNVNVGVPGTPQSSVPREAIKAQHPVAPASIATERRGHMPVNHDPPTNQRSPGSRFCPFGRVPSYLIVLVAAGTVLFIWRIA